MSRARDLADLGGSADAGGLTGRNLIINGAMQVAQRGTSSTSAGYQTVDRFKNAFSGVAVTQSQETLTSGDPYDAGFRHFYRLANTSVSSATSAYAQVEQRFEAQDISKSAWNYKSSSSHITISFWARSSLTGTYYVQLRTHDGTEYRRNLSFTLVADTWKKIEVTTAGNSNLQIDNDADVGLSVFITPHYGSDFTGGEEVSTTDWFDRNGQADAYYPDYAQNWSNTTSATFDITGVQLEVGETATPFEHESYDTTLLKCARYCYRISAEEDAAYLATGFARTTTQGWFNIWLPVPLRSGVAADLTLTDGGTFRIMEQGTSQNNASLALSTSFRESLMVTADVASGLAVGDSIMLRNNTASTSFIQIDCEI